MFLILHKDTEEHLAALKYRMLVEIASIHQLALRQRSTNILKLTNMLIKLLAMKVRLHNNESNCAIMGFDSQDFTDGPVWCLEGKHVTLGSEYVLCPTIEEILLHFDPEDIIVADEFVPPPCNTRSSLIIHSYSFVFSFRIVCHDSCLTCEVAHDSSQCLTCHEGEELTGNAPNACNGTGYQEIGRKFKLLSNFKDN